MANSKLNHLRKSLMILSLVLLVGCGGGNNQTNPPAPTPPPPPANPNGPIGGTIGGGCGNVGAVGQTVTSPMFASLSGGYNTSLNSISNLQFFLQGGTNFAPGASYPVIASGTLNLPDIFALNPLYVGQSTQFQVCSAVPNSGAYPGQLVGNQVSIKLVGIIPVRGSNQFAMQNQQDALIVEIGIACPAYLTSNTLTTQCFDVYPGTSVNGIRYSTGNYANTGYQTGLGYFPGLR